MSSPRETGEAWRGGEHFSNQNQQDVPRRTSNGAMFNGALGDKFVMRGAHLLLCMQTKELLLQMGRQACDRPIAGRRRW